MNIVILGHVCIDRNTSENSSYTAAGSPAMFMTKIFRQLPDCDSEIIAPYGKDFLQFAKEVKLYPAQPTVEHTLVYENITKGKKRIQKCYYYEEALPVKLTFEIKAVLKQADVLYVAPLAPDMSPEYLQLVTQCVHKDTFKIFLPQGYFRDFDTDNVVIFREFRESDMILPMFDAIVVSEQDYPDMHHAAKKWAHKDDVIVAVTTGENGAEVFTKTDEFSVPTEPVAEDEVVDSVGSGDIFSAGFGYWYKKTGELKKSVEFANRLARQCLFYTSDKLKIDFEKLIVK